MLEGKKEELKVPAEPGFNQFAWDLRYPEAKGLNSGPVVVGDEEASEA